MMATILIVDDRASNRQFLTTLLGYGGHRLLEAADGAEALAITRAEHPGLVITDILMPNMDGYEFVQHLRNHSELAATPVIFYTATYSAPEARLLGESCGVDIVLPKPCEPQEMLAAVNKALGVALSAPVASVAAKQATADAGSLRRIDDTGNTRFARDLRSVKLEFDEVFEHSAKLIAQRDVARGLSRKLSANVASLQRVMTHLSALIEVGMQMESERDPAKLVLLFFTAACDIIDSKYAAVGVLDEEELAIRHVFAKGLEPRILQAGDNGRSGLLGSLLAGRRAIRSYGRDSKAGAAGLPAEHPPVTSVLAVPIVSADRVYGWIYFADKSGAGGFSAEDERFANLMATKFALLYENRRLYDVIQRHAAKLQLEAAERKRAEARIRRLNRVYAVLSGINSAIVRIRNREELFREACRIAVSAGEFVLARVIALDQNGKAHIAATSEPDAAAFLEVLEEFNRDPEIAQSLLAQALRTGQTVVSNDLANDPRVPNRAALTMDGTYALAVLPLTVDQRVVGAFLLRARDAGMFDAEELRLLLEMVSDMSFALEHISHEERLNYLAMYDPLTGLANRSLFLERLNQFILAAGPSGTKVALVLADIERLRSVNESLGRQAGDGVIKELAERLAGEVGKAELARIGADQIVIVLRAIKGKSEVTRRIERLWHSCLAEPFRVSGAELRIAVKAGVTLFPNDGAEAELLLRNVEAALVKAKELGERYVFYTSALTARTGERLTLENRLRQALENEEFVLHYQPKVEMQTRRIVGVEALIRWQSPALGLVPPGSFIPLMEETGLILDVGAWALGKAIEDHYRWTKLGLPAPRVAVNVSAIQLRRRDFLSTVEEALKRGATPPGVDLEITESLVMEDIESNMQKLKEVRGLGLSIAIDDFGTGYSSLGYLAKLPVQTLKIDRSFIITMLKDADTMTLVQTIISLAHSLRLKVIAEGVDQEEQAKMLRLLGCDEMQGYLYSKPIPFAEMTALLEQGANSSK